MAATGYSPIQLYYSTTASAAPTAGNLASGELAINITDGKLYYKDNAGAVQLLSTSTTANGTANGVLYLNGSKVATAGSALTFDGTNLGIGVASPTLRIQAAVSGATTTFDGLNVTNGTAQFRLGTTGASYSYAGAGANETWLYSAGTTPLTLGPDGNAPIKFVTNGSEAMRLTSTGLGIGTSSPSYKVDASGQIRALEGGTGSGNGGLIGSTSAQNGNAGVLFQTNNASRWNITTSGTNGANLRVYNYALGSTIATFDSSGNLGIGTSSPQGQLSIGSAASGQKGLTLDWTGAGGPYAVASFTADRGTGEIRNFAYTNFFQTWYSNNTEKMRLDNSGNLGLGVTPNSWFSSRKVLQINSASTSFTGVTDGTSEIWSNAYLDAAANTKYVANGYATLQQNNYGGTGGIRWMLAPSGTAGATTTFTQAMTLDASGRLGIGATSLTEYLTVKSPNASTFFSLQTATDSGVYMGNNVGALTLLTASTERARIDSSGNLLVGTTSAGGKLTVDHGSGNGVGAFTSTNNTSTKCYFVYSGAAGADTFRVFSNGNVVNTNSSYGAISDAKLKENIVDATPKLEKLNQVRIVNFNMVGSEQKQIGVIAQELEQIFPGMVDETPDCDRDGNDLGTTTKSVKYSVFVPMLIKAIQEQQAQIESLRKRLADAGIA